MNKKDTSAFWVLLCLFAASIEPIIVKMGYKGNITPLQFLTYKSLFAAIAVLPITRAWGWIGLRKVFLVLKVSLLLFITNGATLFSLKHLSVVTVITAIKITPALVALVNQRRGKDILDSKFWFGFLLCFLGVSLTMDALGSTTHSFPIEGLVALGIAVISSTIYRTQIEDVMEQVPPKTVSTYIFLLNAFFVSIFILPWIDKMPESAIYISLWMGLAAAIANVAFLAAIHLVGSTRMSIFDMLQRPLIIILAAVILKEPLTFAQIAGVILVFVGVKLAKVKRVIVIEDNILKKQSIN